MPVNDSYVAAYRAASEISSMCVGGFLDRVISVSTGNRSLVDIALIQVPHLGDVTFSFENIWHATFDNLDNLEASFVEEVLVSRLSGDDEHWPAIPGGIIKRFKGMPELIFFHLKGPVEVVIIAAIVAVLRTRDAPG